MNDNDWSVSIVPLDAHALMGHPPNPAKPRTGAPYRRMWVTATHSSGWQVDAVMEPVAGRAEPVQMNIFPPAGEPITGDAVRKLPLGSIFAWMRQRIRLLDKAQQARRPDLDLIAEELVSGRPQRGQPLSSAALAEVALVYRDAWESGQPVTKAVSQKFNISLSTASKRIMKARAAHLLDGVGPNTNKEASS